MALIADDPQEAINSALSVLEKMMNDRDVPRNVKEVIAKAIEYLKREDRDYHMRASAAADALNEITEKQNVPRYLRQRIRQVIVMLESVPPGS